MDLKDDLKRTKQRLLKFLLRHGYHYDSDKYWTGRHRKWLKNLEFPLELEAASFEQYLISIEHLEERIVRIEERITRVAESPEYAQRVKKFRAFKGIDYLIALSLVCEIGDFRRFPNAGSFMSYLGLVPSEYSSGKKRKQGGITKTGNAHIRTLLIEAAWHYRWSTQAGARLIERRKGTEETVIAYADKALRRLHRKYSKLTFNGKSKNTAITAVARELAGFLWGVMTMTA